MKLRLIFCGVLLLSASMLSPGFAEENRDGKDLPPAAPKPDLGGKETPGLFQKHLQTSLADTPKIVFATRASAREWHFFATTGYQCGNVEREYFSAHGGGLYILDLRTLEKTAIFEDAGGAIRDPCLSYDAEKVLFSYRPAGTKVYHLYEINVDGSGLTQLTDGEFDDIECIYLPDGDILFSSVRARRYVPCFNSQVSTLYRCEPDGSNIRMLSNGQENELTPWMLPDGRVIYMRWEYVERHILTFHHLWTINPDGTGEMVYFGNNADSYVSIPGGPVMTDAKPIPGTDKVVSIFGSRHGNTEYAGHVTIVDATEGPDRWENVTYLTSGDKKDFEDWRDPYPITDDCFLVAKHNELYVMDGMGNYERFYTLDAGDVWIHEPRPFKPRPREPIIPEQTDYSKTTGQLILASAHEGRNMEGIAPGTVKSMLVLEVLPKPISGGTDKVYGTGHNLKRILGTVPVEPDGSAYAELPAMRALMFVLLDENQKAVKRMRSFINLMPGEVTSCVGCHEERTRTVYKETLTLDALKRGPSLPQLAAAVPEDGLIDYQRDVQPILTKHCMECHNYKREKSKLVLDGAVQPDNARGYEPLRRMSSLARSLGNDAPYTAGSGASPLLKMLEAGHQDVRLSPAEMDVLRLWIDSGARYAATFATMHWNGRAGVGATDNEQDLKRGIQALVDATFLTQRCDTCHEPGKNGRRYLDEDYFDLTTAEHSLFAMAPLARAAGGLGWCRAQGVEKGEGQVFASREDPGYQQTLEIIREIGATLGATNQHWTGEYVASPVYVREMKRYGVLPPDFDPTAPLDPFEVDQEYYRLFYPEANRR